MAASKKKVGTPELFCQIGQYIKAQDPDFHAAFESMCMLGALSPKPGVTFLYPTSAAHRKEICALVSDDSEKALKMMEALIIPITLLAAEDWQRGSVGALTGVKYSVVSAAGGKVTLAGEGKESLVLERAADFKQLAKYAAAPRAAVWAILSGRPPLAGDKFERPSGKAHGKIKGGGWGAPPARARLAMTVEAATAAARGAGGPYLAKVCGLLAHLKAKNPALFAALAPLIDWDPAVTFYLFVEPYKTSGDYMIPDAVLADWGGVDGFGDCTAAYKACCEADAKARDPAQIAARVDAVRLQICGADGSSLNKVRTPTMTMAAYEALVSSNKIDGMGPIFSDATLRLIGSPAKKAWQDELRFVLHNALQEVAGRYEPAEFRNVTEMLRVIRPGNNYAKESSIFNSPLSRTNVAPNADMGYLQRLINCSDFLYVACPEAHVGAPMGAAADPRDLTVYNRNASALAALNATVMPARQGVSAGAIAELRAYVAQFGALPAEVTALVAAASH